MRIGTAKGSIQRRLPHGVIPKRARGISANPCSEKIEIDAWPSDCIVMAAAQRTPIYVSLDVWDEVEDMTEALRKMLEEGSHREENDEEEDS